MYIRNKCVSIIWKSLIAVIALSGLLLQMGLPKGVLNWNIYGKYTNLSNALVFFYFAAAVIWLLYHLKDEKAVTFLPRIKGAVVMCIVVTGLIYHFMLSKAGKHTTANFILHYMVPAMTVLDWLLFDRKGVFTKLSPCLWLIPPYLYLGFALIVAQIGQGFGKSSRYPYPFLNVDKLGAGTVIITVLVLTAVFLTLGYIIYFLDRWMGKSKKRSTGTLKQGF